MRALAVAVYMVLTAVVPGTATPLSVSSALTPVAEQCGGFQVLSTHRPRAVIAGTHRLSLHHYGLAVDFRVGNYGCAYAVLSNWGRGLSLDAWRMGHIHISDGSSIGRDEGRFYHYASRSRHRQHHTIRGHRHHHAVRGHRRHHPWDRPRRRTRS